MLPPRRPADEHELAGECASVGECNSVSDRPGREQDIPQTIVPERSLPTRTEHDTDHSICVLLCE